MPKKPWRPHLDDAVMYLDDYDRTWRRGKVHSYEGETTLRIYLKCGIACAVFRLHELKKPTSPVVGR